MLNEVIGGKAYAIKRSNIDTDAIIPPSNLSEYDQQKLAPYAMSGIVEGFAKKVSEKRLNILVTGGNLGCGSMRAHAVWALVGAGIRAIIAPSYARTFYRSAIDSGNLIPLTVDESVIEELNHADQLEIYMSDQTIKNLTSGKNYKFKPFEKELQGIIEAGGLAEYNKQRERRGEIKFNRIPK